MDSIFSFAGQHVGLFAALGVILVLLAVNEATGSLGGLKRMSIADAVRLINDREPLLIDCRTPAEFKRGHLLNALNVSLNRFDEEIGRVGKDKSRPVLVYCQMGPRSDSAFKKLVERGYSEVYVLKGGINAWQGASLPVVTK